MNILLINSNQLKQPIPVIPIGICWIVKELEKKGYHAGILDLTFSENCERDIQKAITEYRPQVVGVSIRNIDDNNSLFFLDDIKKRVIQPCKQYFNGPLVIGGSAVGIGGREMLDYFDLDYAICGSGEHVFVEFLERFQKNKPVHRIKGLIVRQNGKIIKENEPASDENFHELSFPDVSKYIDVKKYQRHNSHVQLQSKRGCALKCTYCSYGMSEGVYYRFRNPGIVAEDIERLYYNEGIDTFEFVDSTFNIPIAHAKAVLKAIISKKLPVRLSATEVNPGSFDEELSDLLQEAHFQVLGISIDSGSDAILADFGKNFTSQNSLDTAALLRTKQNNGWKDLHLFWSVLLGSSKETIGTLAETLDFIKQIVRPYESVFVATGIRVYKGTPLAGQLEAQNMKITDDNYLSPVLLEPENISIGEIAEIAREWSEDHPNIILINDFRNEQKLNQHNKRLFMQKILFDS